MKKIITYLLFWLICLIIFYLVTLSTVMPQWYTAEILYFNCTYAGILGGILYCLMAIYLNRAVLDIWDDKWAVWYYLRPIMSGISGFISAIFLKAGLLVLAASKDPNSVTFGFTAVAFIAGYNVDNFLKRLESIAHSAWGISRSRIGSEDENVKDD